MTVFAADSIIPQEKKPTVCAKKYVNSVNKSIITQLGGIINDIDSDHGWPIDSTLDETSGEADVGRIACEKSIKKHSETLSNDLRRYRADLVNGKRTYVTPQSSIMFDKYLGHSLFVKDLISQLLDPTDESRFTDTYKTSIIKDLNTFISLLSIKE